MVRKRLQVFGPESSGKTTLAMHAIGAVQKQGGTAALIDAEHAFDPVYSRVSAATVLILHCGVPLPSAYHPYVLAGALTSRVAEYSGMADSPGSSRS